MLSWRRCPSDITAHACRMLQFNALRPAQRELFSSIYQFSSFVCHATQIDTVVLPKLQPNTRTHIRNKGFPNLHIHIQQRSGGGREIQAASDMNSILRSKTQPIITHFPAIFRLDLAEIPEDPSEEENDDDQHHSPYLDGAADAVNSGESPESGSAAAAHVNDPLVLCCALAPGARHCWGVTVDGRCQCADEVIDFEGCVLV